MGKYAARDSQRKKVYEWGWQCPEFKANKFSLEDCQTIVEVLWSLYEMDEYKDTPPVVIKRSRARAWGQENNISLPEWARNYRVICHEVAHSIICAYYYYTTSGKPLPVAMHGPEFMRVYVELLEYCGYDTLENLIESATAAKVKIEEPLDWLVPAHKRKVG